MSVNNSGEDSDRPSSGRLSRLPKGSLIRFFSFVLFLFFFISSSHAQVIERIKYYDVGGSTTGEFKANWRSIQQKQGYSGRCEYEYNKTFSIARNFDGSWGVSNFNLRMEIILILPRAHYPAGMSRQERAIYDNLRRIIYAHELKHRQQKLEFYRAYNNSVRNLYSYNAGGVSSQVSRIERYLDAEMNRKDKFLDSPAQLAKDGF